jgi:pyrimidine-nucleoside phosphorylase
VDALVLDVKTGSGAFMKKEEDAVFLAELMVETGEAMGKAMVALITNMDEPLGMYVGNSLEVAEVLDVLRGKGPEDLRELCLELAGWMFHLGGAAETVAQGRSLSQQLITSGKALEKFQQMVGLQSGDARVIANPDLLPHTKHTLEVTSPNTGRVAAIDCEAVGTACVVLGGGRERKEDAVDPAVGIVLHSKVGDSVKAGESLATVHYNSETRGLHAKQMLLRSYQISDTQNVVKKKLVHRVIQGSRGK